MAVTANRPKRDRRSMAASYRRPASCTPSPRNDVPAMTELCVLDLAPVPDGAEPGDALRRARTLAQHAERWGYRRYWMAEHHNMIGIASAATAVCLGYVAEGT